MAACHHQLQAAVVAVLAVVGGSVWAYNSQSSALVARQHDLARVEEELKRLEVPTLVIVGDEDEPCLEPSFFLKRVIPRCGLLVLPQSGCWTFAP